METERKYTPAQIDKITQLDRAWDTSSRLSRRYRTQGCFPVITMEATFIIDPQFLWGVHLIRRALMMDCISLGLKDEVSDIVSNHLRKGH